MSSKDWEKLEPTFSSLLDGCLMEKLPELSNEELKPFLPILIYNSFGSSGTQYNQTLMARLSSFSEGNRILHLLNADYTEIELDLKSPKPLNYPFVGMDDFSKIRLLLFSLLHQDLKDKSTLSSIVANESIKEATLLLQVAYLKIPHIFNLERMIHKILHVKNAFPLIGHLVCNAPELLDPIISIVKTIEVSDECEKGIQRGFLLDALFQMCPHIVWPVLEDMSISRRDLRLACMQRKDDRQLLSFFCSQLIHRDSDTIAAQAIAKISSKYTLAGIYRELSRIGFAASDDVLQTETLRLFVFLQQHCTAKLTREQMDIFCPLLCRTIGEDSDIIFTVAIIMSIQSLTLSLQQAGVLNHVDPRILQYFQWLREIVKEGSRSSLIQQLIYIASCVYSNKIDQLNSMFSGLLRIKISIHPRHLNALVSILQDNFMNSEEVAKECAKLPITTNLNADSGSRLPINSVYLCFVKHGIDIASWLEAQLRSCSYPIHNLLPELIERFAALATANNLPGLSIRFVNEVFDGALLDERTIPVRVLTFLFLLSYRSNLDQLGSKAFEVHGADTFAKLPARYLLSVAMSRTKDFGPIQAPLTRLATDVCPYMLPTVGSVIAVKNLDTRTIPLDDKPDELLQKLNRYEELHSVVKKLQLAPISDKVNCVKVVVRAFKTSLGVKSSSPVVESILQLYKELDNFVPRILYETSAMEWLGGSATTLRLADVYEHPALLFRSDRRIFSSHIHFRCFTSALEFFMQASRNNLQRKIHAANVASKNDADKQERDTLSVVFDNTQASLIVQLLVEVSDEKKMKDDPNDDASLLRRKKVREIACAFIHQMFIGDPQVLKLVLFQGLPLHMIRCLVEEIPSMFVAIDHMQDMLTLPDLKRRTCAVSLMVAISRKYRISTTCNMTDFILNILSTLLRYAENFMNLKLFLKIVPSLAEIIGIFPQLAGDVTALLLKISTMAKARLALQPLVIRPDCDERRLMDLITKSLSEQVEAQAW